MLLIGSQKYLMWFKMSVPIYFKTMKNALMHVWYQP